MRRKYIFYKTKSIFEQIIKRDIRLIEVYNPHDEGIMVGASGNNIVVMFNFNHPQFGGVERLNYRRFTQYMAFCLFESYKVFGQLEILASKLDIPHGLLKAVAYCCELYRTRKLYYRLYPGAKVWDERLAEAIEFNPDDPLNWLYCIAIGKSVVFADEKFESFRDEVLPLLKQIENGDWKTTLALLPQITRIILKYRKRKEGKPLMVSSSTSTQTSQEREDSSAKGIGSQGHDEKDEKEDSEESSEVEGSIHTHEQKETREEIQVSDGENEEEEEDFQDSRKDVGEDEGNKGDEQREEGEEERTSTLSEEYETLEKEFEELREPHDDEFGEMREMLSQIIRVAPSQEDLQIHEELFDTSVSEIVQKSAEDITSKLQEIQRQIFGVREIDEDQGIVGRVLHLPELFLSYTVDYEPLWNVVNRLKQIFRRLKGREQEVNDIVGSRVDLFENLQEELSGETRETFLLEEQSLGLNIVILLDCSGSMAGKKIELAARACLTLYKALEGIHGIDFEVYGYSADKYGNIIIAKLDDQSLKRVDVIEWTPTWAAVRYATNVLDQKQGKRMVILITDGHPEIRKLPDSVCAKITFDEIKRARRKGIQVYTFFICPYYLKKEELTKIFGVEHTIEIVWKPEELEKKLISFVLNKVVRSFYSS